jgi:hypothetical protein
VELKKLLFTCGELSACEDKIKRTAGDALILYAKATNM